MLEVGQQYITRGDKLVTIVAMTVDNVFCWDNDGNIYHTNTGGRLGTYPRSMDIVDVAALTVNPVEFIIRYGARISEVFVTKTEAEKRIAELVNNSGIYAIEVFEVIRRGSPEVIIEWGNK